METNVDGVTKLMLFHLQVIQSNIHLIDISFSKISSHARTDEEDEEVAPEDDDDTEPSTKRPRIGPSVDRSGRGSRGGRRKCQPSTPIFKFTSNFGKCFQV